MPHGSPMLPTSMRSSRLSANRERENVSASRDPLMTPPSLLDVPHLNGWAAQWDQLVDSSPLPSPFLRSWWLAGAGGPGRHFLLVVDGPHLLGGLALEQRHPVLSVRMMGDGSL